MEEKQQINDINREFYDFRYEETEENTESVTESIMEDVIRDDNNREPADTGDGYLVSNVGDDGQIVPFYNGIKPDHLLTIEDIQGCYHISNIGYANNLDTHIFQISGEGAYGTVEWVCMDAAEYGLFVPYYPMLTESVFGAYEAGCGFAEYAEEEPAEGVYFACLPRGG